MDLKQIYTQVITENSRDVSNKHQLVGATHILFGVNPTCGDEITLELKVQGQVIKDAAYIGDGCAISQASANMMVNLIKGRTLTEVQKLTAIFMEMIKGQKVTPASLDVLEEAQALGDVAHLPARVKCAVLSWHTLAGLWTDQPK